MLCDRSDDHEAKVPDYDELCALMGDFLPQKLALVVEDGSIEQVRPVPTQPPHRTRSAAILLQICINEERHR